MQEKYTSLFVYVSCRSILLICICTHKENWVLVPSEIEWNVLTISFYGNLKKTDNTVIFHSIWKEIRHNYWGHSIMTRIFAHGQSPKLALRRLD